MKPFRMAFDTGAGYNIVNKRILPRSYEEYMTRDSDVPALCAANGKRLATHSAVVLKVRVGNPLFTTRFMVAERLAGDVIIATVFLNRNVEAIRPRSQMLELRGGGAVPILSTQHGRDVHKPFRKVTEDKEGSHEHTGATLESPTTTKRQRRQGDATPIKVAKRIAIPPMIQTNVTVVCDAGGLHLVEPRASIQERQRIWVTNGIVDLKPRERFTIVVANYSRVTCTIARGVVIAMAALNPVGIYSLDENASLAFEKVLNLPPEREVTPQTSTSAEADAKPPAKEEGD